MNPTDCIKENINELREIFFVAQIGIFGSFARGESTTASDVDILVEFDRPVDLFHFIALQDRLTEITGRKVDLATTRALKPLIKDQILREVIYI